MEVKCRYDETQLESGLFLSETFIMFGDCCTNLAVIYTYL